MTILYGICTNLMSELEIESQGDFINYMRMDTNYRRALEPGLKLVLTLRYMVNGKSYHSFLLPGAPHWLGNEMSF